MRSSARLTQVRIQKSFKYFSLFAFIFFSALHGQAANIDYNSYLYPQMNLKENSDWFEWWYTKVVDPYSGRGFYFTYGVVNPGVSAGPGAQYSRASVSFGDFKNKWQAEVTSPMSAFTASTQNYEVSIRDFNRADPVSAYASSRILTGEVFQDGKHVKWDLSFRDTWGYNVMGWAMSIPRFLNIYWYPVQGSVKITGVIQINDEEIFLDQAPGYQDRNWGTDFPAWWTWIVANHFEGQEAASETVLVAGGGAPSILGRRSPYEGVSLGLRHEGKVYAFRPVDGVLPKTNIQFGKWEVKSKNLRGEEIEIFANAPKESFMDLQFLAPNGKVFHDYETLNGNLVVKLKKSKNAPWVELRSTSAGIEFGSYEVFPPNGER